MSSTCERLRRYARAGQLAWRGVVGVEARRRESIHHACLCCAGMCERKKLQDDRLRNVSERSCVCSRGSEQWGLLRAGIGRPEDTVSYRTWTD